MATTFRQAYLDGESRFAESPDQLVSGSYDVLVMASSWDSRCLSLLTTTVRAHDGIGIFFANRGITGLREQHDPRVRDFLQERCARVATIEQPSEALDDLWAELWTALWTAFVRLQRPVRVLLDLSTCPRYYAMALFAGGIRRGVISSITCFYAEGRYPPSPRINPNDEFTAGRWAVRDVPMLAGTADPGNDRLYIVSVGFEGSKTYRAVSNDDPNRVAVLFPSPGVDSEYPARTRERNRLLFEEYGVRAQDVVCAPAGDAVEAWRMLANADLIRKSDNPFYLCCGTKPHSLAMAAHAMLDEHITVLYAQPASHKEIQIDPSGVYWTYTFRDLTHPTRTS